MVLCKAIFGDLADAYVQAGRQKDFQTFIVAFALIILLTALGVCFYCFQRYRHGHLHHANVQAGASLPIPLSCQGFR